MAARHKGKHKARYHTRLKPAREITLPPMQTAAETSVPVETVTDSPVTAEHQETASE